MRKTAFALIIAMSWPFELAAGLVSATAAVLDTVSDSITQRNPVTGRVALNTVSLAREIELGKGYEKQYLQELGKQGIQFNRDRAALARIGGVLKNLTPVSHLPDFPWRYHFSDSMEWNACAMPGGTIIVNKGLLDSVDDNELAAILGHELAHVTCRHIAERQGQQLGTSLFSDEARTNHFYRAHFSTAQENQADQIGVMYMAAGGYDPLAASQLWEKMYKKHGAGNAAYTSDHGLNYERAALTKKFAQDAAQYYLGPGKMNPHPAYLKSLDLGKNDNKILNLIAAGIVLSRQHDQTHAEAEQRKKMNVALNNIKFLSLTSKRPSFSKTTYWEGKIQNTNSIPIQKVIMELYYLDSAGNRIRTEAWGIDNLGPGEIRVFSGELKANPGERFSAALTQVQL